MAKQKSIFICSSCEYQTLKWMGCCPECQQWNTLTEVVSPSSAARASSPTSSLALQTLEEICTKSTTRMRSGIEEWDRVMGGGIMPKSLLVLTGDPGIGKSTLLLQIASKLAQQYRVFYFSTEESLQQVKQRAQRIECTQNTMLFSDNASLDAIVATAEQEKPDIIIIDSIQNCILTGLQSLPGSVSQLREATFQLMRLAKQQGVTVIVTGHITKEGVIAGPKTLEHMVDAVFYLQGEDQWQTRILRAVKNRFGTINELGFFEMNEEGLREMPNINEHLLSDISHSPGSSLVSVMEGSRPLFLELQALTIESKLGIPQRVISGLDHKQVVLVAAILQKYLHIKLSLHDIFFKVSGGFKIKSSAADLGIALSILSSYFQQPLAPHTLALGELSLTGQIKPITQVNIFVREAEKFGIQQLLVAHNQKIDRSSCRVRPFRNVFELLNLFETT